MTSLLNTLKTAAQKHAAYMRTRRAIEAMPAETALDLGIYPGDARKLAHDAVYGH